MPSLFLLFAAAAASPGAHPSHLLNMPEVFTADDYPPESIRSNDEGEVEVRLRVGPSGSIERCTILKSSGHAALDARTCELLRSRGKFEPATNRSGHAVGSDLTQKVVWKLQDGPEPTMPRSAWMLRLTMEFTRDQQLLGCSVESTNLPNPQMAKCIPGRDLKPGGAEADPFAYAIIETRFFPVDAADAPVPPDVEGAQKVARQVSRMTITPDGQVIACEAFLYSGEASPAGDQCEMNSRMHFEPDAKAAEPLTGTLVQTVYARRADAAKAE